MRTSTRSIPRPLDCFFPLPVGHAWGPAQDGTPRPPVGAWSRGWIPTAKGFEDGGRIALVGIGENHGQMPWTETLLGSVHQGFGLRVGPLPHDEGDHQLTIRGDCSMIPQVTGRRRLLVAAALRLFLTYLPC